MSKIIDKEKIEEAIWKANVHLIPHDQAIADAQAKDSDRQWIEAGDAILKGPMVSAKTFWQELKEKMK